MNTINATNNTYSGIGFLGLLALLFVAFKLMNVITWSWWLVLSPVLIPIALGVVLVMVLWLVMISLAIQDYKHQIKPDSKMESAIPEKKKRGRPFGSKNKTYG